MRVTGWKESSKKAHDAVLSEYRKKKMEFTEKYEVQENEYDRCYDICGILRNSE